MVFGKLSSIQMENAEQFLFNRLTHLVSWRSTTGPNHPSQSICDAFLLNGNGSKGTASKLFYGGEKQLVQEQLFFRFLKPRSCFVLQVLEFSYQVLAFGFGITPKSPSVKGLVLSFALLEGGRHF